MGTASCTDISAQSCATHLVCQPRLDICDLLLCCLARALCCGCCAQSPIQEGQLPQSHGRPPLHGSCLLPAAPTAPSEMVACRQSLH